MSQPKREERRQKRQQLVDMLASKKASVEVGRHFVDDGSGRAALFQEALIAEAIAEKALAEFDKDTKTS